MIHPWFDHGRLQTRTQFELSEHYWNEWLCNRSEWNSHFAHILRRTRKLAFARCAPCDVSFCKWSKQVCILHMEYWSMWRAYSGLSRRNDEQIKRRNSIAQSNASLWNTFDRKLPFFSFLCLCKFDRRRISSGDIVFMLLFLALSPLWWSFIFVCRCVRLLACYRSCLIA